MNRAWKSQICGTKAKTRNFLGITSQDEYFPEAASQNYFEEIFWMSLLLKTWGISPQFFCDFVTKLNRMIIQTNDTDETGSEIPYRKF